VQESLWVQFQCIPDSLQGCHAKTLYAWDEGTLLAVYEYMAGAGLHATTEDLAKAITSFWLHLAKNSESKTQTDDCINSDGGLRLATRTAREWLDRMEYNWKDLRKGVYRGGHERKEVVDYRVSTFLPRIKALEPYMAT